MPLVDYASDSDDASAASTEHLRDDTPSPPKTKRPRTASPPRHPVPAPSGSGSTLTTTTTTTTTTATTTTTPTATKAPTPRLPPLPPAFHDLYASTVRTAPRDDPALHQGRTRQIPHVPGLWPSHVYVEWRPAPPVHALLCELLAALQQQQQQQQQVELQLPQDVVVPAPKGGDTGPGPGPEPITGFLQSDVGVPQPLHVSLSRPLALSTEQKAQFLSELEAALAGGGGGGGGGQGGGGGRRRRVTSFSLRCSRVEWHRTAESGRSFLVLRVRSASSSSSRSSSSSSSSRSSRNDTSSSNSNSNSSGGGDGDARRRSRDDNEEEEEEGEEGNVNPELTELLRRCNEVAERHGQPALYRWAEEGAVDEADKRIGEAFHVSIAWSFAEPTEELVRATERVFGSQEIIDKIREIEIPVEGVKVKIGNVVTHVALEQRGKKVIGKGTKNLLGL